MSGGQRNKSRTANPPPIDREHLLTQQQLVRVTLIASIIGALALVVSGIIQSGISYLCWTWQQERLNADAQSQHMAEIRRLSFEKKLESFSNAIGALNAGFAARDAVRGANYEVFAVEIQQDMGIAIPGDVHDQLVKEHDAAYKRFDEVTSDIQTKLATCTYLFSSNVTSKIIPEIQLLEEHGKSWRSLRPTADEIAKIRAVYSEMKPSFDRRQTLRALIESSTNGADAINDPPVKAALSAMRDELSFDKKLLLEEAE